jgi:hypothetical protein
VSQDFYESSSPKALENNIGVNVKFAEIFAGQGAPPVSTTPAVIFATGTAGVVDTGGKLED